MIPILYDKSETAFKSNGLGRLKDATDCKVSEERNGQYELSMTYPVNGQHYSDIAIGRIIVAQPSLDAEPQPFEIYHVTKPLNMKVTIDAEHISYRLKYIPVRAFSTESLGATLSALRNNAIVSCPFSFDTDKSVSGQFVIEDPASIRSLLTDGEESITSIYGGEWEFDKFACHLRKSRGRDNGVKVRYGKNMSSFEQEENVENMVTGIYPYWKGQDENDADIYLELPEKVVPTIAGREFSYQRVIPVDFSSNLEGQEITRSWTETSEESTVDPSTSRVHTETKVEDKTETIKIAPTEASLREQAELYIKANGLDTPDISFSVGVAELRSSAKDNAFADLNTVHLCDIVSVEFPKLGITTKAKVISTEFDVLTERYTNITIGNPKETLTNTVKKAVKNSEKKTNKTITETKNGLNKNINAVDQNLTTAKRDLGLRITQNENSITSTAKQVETIGNNQTTMQTSISQNAESISSTAQKVETINGVQNKMQTSITQNANEIALKVSADSVIASINASKEGITISGDKINISGNTTFTSLQNTANSAASTASSAASTASSALSTANSKLSASDLGAGGTTNIDGGRITTGTISADRIEGISINKIVTGDSYRVVSEKSFEENGSAAFQKCFDNNMKRYSIKTDTLDNVRARLRALEK